MADPMFDLAGKVALITGGSRGLGREMALAFADAGADVIISSRNIDACEAVASEIGDKGRRALAIAALLKAKGVSAVPAAPAGQRFALMTNVGAPAQ